MTSPFSFLILVMGAFLKGSYIALFGIFLRCSNLWQDLLDDVVAERLSCHVRLPVDDRVVADPKADPREKPLVQAQDPASLGSPRLIRLQSIQHSFTERACVPRTRGGEQQQKENARGERPVELSIARVCSVRRYVYTCRISNLLFTLCTGHHCCGLLLDTFTVVWN